MKRITVPYSTLWQDICMLKGASLGQGERAPDVWDVNQGVTNCNRCTQRLVIYRAQTH